jgi:DNA-binding MarR family transcriptional regulator
MPLNRDPQSLLPLTPALFHVLVALADGETHGYAIMKEVERLTDGAVRLSTGTLYGIVKRLLAEGLVKEARPGGDTRRRKYELTRFGTDVARAEARRLEQTLTLARRKALYRTYLGFPCLDPSDSSALSCDSFRPISAATSETR